MKKEQDHKTKMPAREPLTDESLINVAGGDTGDPGQPALETFRNDYAMGCNHYLSKYSPSVGLCSRCEFGVVIEDLCPDVWKADGRVACNWVWYRDPRYKNR